MKHQKKLLAAMIGGALISGSALATNGYAPHGIGMKSKGMGGVYIAHQGDAVAVGGNPAGSAWMDNRVDVGVELFRPQREAEISGHIGQDGTTATGANGVYDGNGLDLFALPEFGYRRGLNEDMAFALSLFGNGGMNTDYKDGIPLFGSRSGIDLAQLFVVPSLSFKFNEDHAFGVGLNLVASRFKANGLENFTGTNSIPNPDFGQPGQPPVLDPQFSESPDKVTNNGGSWSYGAGVRLGWMGKVSNTVTLGATYQSRTYMSEFDDYAGLFAEQGDFDIPSNYGVGIAMQATPSLRLMADVMRINYSEVDSIANPLLPNLFNCQTLGGPDPDSCLGGDNGAGFGWDDMTVFKLGVEYQFNPTLVLRAGWNHGKQPIPESETLFNILAPATVEDHITLGGTWTLNSGMEVTASYMHALENTVEGSGSIPPGFGGGEADLTMYQDSIGIAFSWKL